MNRSTLTAAVVATAFGACSDSKPEPEPIEEPAVHPLFDYGRPDIRLDGRSLLVSDSMPECARRLNPRSVRVDVECLKLSRIKLLNQLGRRWGAPEKRREFSCWYNRADSVQVILAPKAVLLTTAVAEAELIDELIAMLDGEVAAVAGGVYGTMPAKVQKSDGKVTAKLAIRCVEPDFDPAIADRPDYRISATASQTAVTITVERRE